MKQSSWTKIFVFFLAFAFLPLSSGQTSKTGATETPDHIALTWIGDPATTMTITWRTDSAIASGIVEYQEGAKLSGKAKRAKAKLRDFMTNLGDARLFTSTLTGLSPDTQYAYRVGNGKDWSSPGTFSTACRKTLAFKFLVFGDSQSSVSGDDPYGIWRKTVQNAFAANRDAKFIVNVGDLVDYGQKAEHWNAWFAAAQGVIDRIPEMPVPGNHEYYGSRDMTAPKYFAEQWVLPQNGPQGMKGLVYSYDYGPVHFVVLNSQLKEQRKQGDMLKAQQAWLEADLAASKAEWKIVFFHKTAYEVYPKRTNEEVKTAFCPILEKHGVDLAFTAHDHAIARTYPIKNGVYMAKPSQGVIYYVSGRSGAKTYDITTKMPWNTFFYNPLDQPNYFVVEMTEKMMTVKAVKLDGTIIDTFFIDKMKDISSDTVAKPEAARSEKQSAA
jgi:hypothetical protein